MGRSPGSARSAPGLPRIVPSPGPSRAGAAAARRWPRSPAALPRLSPAGGTPGPRREGTAPPCRLQLPAASFPARPPTRGRLPPSAARPAGTAAAASPVRSARLPARLRGGRGARGRAQAAATIFLTARGGLWGAAGARPRWPIGRGGAAGARPPPYTQTDTSRLRARGAGSGGDGPLREAGRDVGDTLREAGTGQPGVAGAGRPLSAGTVLGAEVPGLPPPPPDICHAQTTRTSPNNSARAPLQTRRVIFLLVLRLFMADAISPAPLPRFHYLLAQMDRGFPSSQGSSLLVLELPLLSPALHPSSLILAHR